YHTRRDRPALHSFPTRRSSDLSARSTYAQRYKYRGDINIRYEQMINSEFGFPDYSKQKIYNIQWSHTQDQKANPSSRFNASVNLGSSTYFRNSMNQQNIGANM